MVVDFAYVGGSAMILVLLLVYIGIGSFVGFKLFNRNVVSVALFGV